MNQDSADPVPRFSFLQRCYRILKRLGQLFLLLIAIYLVIVLIGLIPVNNDFEPTDGGIEVFLVSNPVHADIVFPIKTEDVDWRERFPAECFSGDTSRATHVAVGWGDKGFFIETPTWADLKVSTAAKALFRSSDTCLHVSLTKAEYLRDARRVSLSVEQYRELVQYVSDSFRLNAEGDIVQVGHGGYSTNDAFFDARGTYHCFNTCNSWVGRAMRAAGLRTGCYTPLPKTAFLYLPD